MRRRRWWKQSLALALSVTMVLTSTQMDAFASAPEEAAGGKDTVVTDAAALLEDEMMSGEGTTEEAIIIGEDETLREQNVKHFIMNDGSMTAVIYGQPVHYEEDGKWLEIDNTLTYEGGEGVYRNTSAPLQVSFAGSDSAASLVEIGNGEHSISWDFLTEEEPLAGMAMPSAATEGSYKGMTVEVEPLAESQGEQLSLRNAVGEMTADADVEMRAEDVMSASIAATESGIAYRDESGTVSLEYHLSGEGLKEDIVLESYTGRSCFQFGLKTEGLSAELTEDGDILFLDGEEALYRMPSPFAYDAAGEYCGELRYIIEEGTDGYDYILAVQVPETWLRDNDRVWPVTIDPMVTTPTSQNAIHTTFISSASAWQATNFSQYKFMLVGRESSSYEYCRTLLRFTLPELKNGDIISKAQLYAACYDKEFYSDSTPDLQVNAYMIKNDWDYSSVTWKTRPDYSGTVLDYDYIKRADVAGQTNWKIFDITKAAKQWYDNEDSSDAANQNYGILLKAADESGSYAENGVKGYLWSERYNDVTDAYPFIALTYRNHKGLENYWTYTEAGAGDAGSAYVNDYTGNLVFVKALASTSGLRMPVSLELVYNSCSAGAKATGYPEVSAGYGWRLNVTQTLKSSGLTGTVGANYPYVYTDGDGTEHYFYKKTEDGKTTYLDEDGLGLTLEPASEGNDYTHTVTGKDGTVMKFFGAGGMSGCLKSITDADGNSMTMGYGGGYLTSITDGAGHSITIVYDEYNRVYKIYDPAGRVTRCTYSSNQIIKVTMPDGSASSYTYDSDGALTGATASDAYKLAFAYTSKEKGKRISAVQESAGVSSGQKMTFSYSNYNETTIRTAGVDGIYGNTDDIRTVMQFDDYGRTKASYSYTGTGDLGAAMAQYTSGSGSTANMKSLNRVTQEAASGKNVVNLLADPGAEKSSGWSSAVWGSGTATYAFSRSDSQAYDGKKAFEIKNTAVSGNAAGRIYQDIPNTVLVPGKTYTLSGYIKVSGINSATLQNYGACIALDCFLSDGTFNTNFSEMVKVSDEGIDDGWKRVMVTVKIPEGTTKTRVDVALRGCKGTAWFDALQLEEGSAANSVNLLENAGFEEGTTGWTLSGTVSGDGTNTTNYKSGATSFKLSGSAGKTKTVSQTVAIPDDAVGESYIVSGFAKADAVAGKNGATFRIRVTVSYKSGSSVITPYYYDASFNRAVSGWQYVCLPVVVGDFRGYTPESITVNINYSGQANTAYFDQIQLVREPSQSYTYDSNGNCISVAANAEQQSTMEYTDDNLTKATDAKGWSYTYAYDGKHHLTKATSQNSVTYNYTYNSYGSATDLKVKNNTGSMVIETGASYSSADTSAGVSAGAYLTSVTDADGYTLSYSYDRTTGVLNSVKDAAGTTVSYTYDSTNDRLTKVSSSGSSVSYSYGTGGILSGITTGTTAYGFSYDVFGNLTQVKAGARTLASYAYGSNNGDLKTLTYGNGTKYGYTYNAYGETTSVSVNGTERYQFLYGSSGNAVRKADEALGIGYDYSYDSTGRLVREYIYDSTKSSSSDRTLYASEYGYDEKNNVNQYTTSAGGRTGTEKYTYGKDNLPTAYTDRNGAVLTYKYDSLNRLDKKSFNTATEILWDVDYWLSKRNGDGEETYRTTMPSTETYGQLNYRYEYDKTGNIIAVKERPTGGSYTTIATYEYDSLGQLTRENNRYKGQSIVYTYDNSGNMTDRKAYAYTTGSLDGKTATETHTYTYGDSGWKDLLTAYDGKSISYDAIGNPVTYLGKTMTWEGRRLLSVNGDSQISYQYDSDGCRTKKTVDGGSGVFWYQDGQLRYEKRGGREYYYGYGSDGALASITVYEGGVKTVWYVLCDVQGDVKAIYDSNGSLAVWYEYDAWGNLISMTDGNGAEITSSTNIGNLNRIRYRGYYWDYETGFYYLGSRYYDPEVGRFINADGYVSTGQGLPGNNMFAYCGNNPVNRTDSAGHFWTSVLEFIETACSEISSAMSALSPAYAGCGGLAVADGPLPIGDTIGLVGAIGLTVGAVGYGTYQAAKVIAVSSEKAESKDKAIATPAPRRRGGTTYYHVTTPENAAVIKATGVMIGSPWECGYVFAWRRKPNRAALKNAGVRAPNGVIISFKTDAAFENDHGIEDTDAGKFYPVHTVMPVPIAVWDVEIVG